MSDDIVVQGFDFFLEEDEGDWSKEWFSGGVNPANQQEIAMWRRIRSDAAEILSLRAELTEQARINGMGAERELKLIAERDEARGEVAAIVAWLRKEAALLREKAIVPASFMVAQASALEQAATAIEARAYVKENDGD